MHSVNELVSDLVNYHQIKEAYPWIILINSRYNSHSDLGSYNVSITFCFDWDDIKL